MRSGAPEEPGDADDFCRHCGASRIEVEGVDGFTAEELRAMGAREGTEAA
jgi:hypothetical protein